VAAANQPTAETAAWELYDLGKDRAESNNLAEKMPEKVSELDRLWTKVTNEFRELATRDLPADKKSSGEQAPSKKKAKKK